MSLSIQRGRDFSFAVEFFSDTGKSSTVNVSGDTYVSELRVEEAVLSTVVHTLDVDMVRAGEGRVVFSLPGASSIGMAHDVVYVDVYRVEGGENVSILDPYPVEVTD